jgi:hypothetical protein
MGKTINNVAEQQQSKKSHDEHGNKLHCQYGAEILYTLKIKQHAIENNKSACPKSNTNCTVHGNTRQAVSFIACPQTIDR